MQQAQPVPWPRPVCLVPMFAGLIFGGHPWLAGNKNDNVAM